MTLPWKQPANPKIGSLPLHSQEWPEDRELFAADKATAFCIELPHLQAVQESLRMAPRIPRQLLEVRAQGRLLQSICGVMAMAVFTIGLPTIYANILTQEKEWEHMVQVSRWASVFLLGVYFAYLLFQLKTHSELFQDEGGEEDEEQPDLSGPSAAALLFVATIVTSFATDFLIDAIRGTVDQWKVSKEFIGIILLHCNCDCQLTHTFRF